MNRILAIVTFIALGLAVVFFALSFFLKHNAATSPTASTTPSGSFSSGNGTSGTSGGSVQGMTVTSTDGQTYTVPDVTAGHPAIQETSGTYHYLTQDAQGNDQYPDFSIVYGSDSSISIGLSAEPLGQARLAAEAQLRKLFPLTDQQLCSLDVTVMTTPSVNETFAGENLGLSFCPGSVKLP